ncbi:MAG: tetratricopeptide repeat protein [Acidobacteriia bacterium]|nr:tetratricopeptide repeat protein [Terriglobia bacterium]
MRRLIQHETGVGLLVIAGMAAGCLSIGFFRPADAPSPQADELYLRGNQMVAEHRIEDAVIAYHRAIRLNPRKADALFALGALFLTQRQPAEAAKALSKFVKLKPWSADGWYMLGRSMEQSGDVRGAASEYKKADALKHSIWQALVGMRRLLGG